MNRLLLSIALPIIALLCLMVYKQSIVNTGETVIFPIKGFDPRDLLSGHYLRYNIDYQAENNCKTESSSVQLCLKPYHRFSETTINSDCQLYLSGICQNGKFRVKNIERFYIPEEYAKKLDTLVRQSKGKLVVSVTNNGNAAIQDLLIDGVSWRTKIEN